MGLLLSGSSLPVYEKLFLKLKPISLDVEC